MALTANLNRDEKKRSEPFSAFDFMNFADVVEEETPVESPEVISARIASELFKM